MTCAVCDTKKAESIVKLPHTINDIKRDFEKYHLKHSISSGTHAHPSCLLEARKRIDKARRRQGR